MNIARLEDSASLNQEPEWNCPHSYIYRRKFILQTPRTWEIHQNFPKPSMWTHGKLKLHLDTCLIRNSMVCLLETFHPRMRGISAKLFIKQPGWKSLRTEECLCRSMHPFSLFYKLHNGKPVRRLRYTRLIEPNDKTIQLNCMNFELPLSRDDY